jgi:hypothetical protein
MTLANDLRTRLFADGPFRDEPRRIVAQGDGITVTCEAVAAESLGCLIRRLDVTDSAAKPLSAGQLRERADRLAVSVIHLHDRLAVIEVDRRHGHALLRSGAPRPSESGVDYFEMLADAGRHATLQRIHWDRRERRRSAIDFAMTPEQLEAVVEELTNAVRPSLD